MERRIVTKAGTTFQTEDLQQIAARGMTLAQLQEQIETFTRGLPFLQLERPCTVGYVITVLSPAEFDQHLEL